MRKIWQSAGAMQVLAAALLALALAGIAVGFYANHRWMAIQGPGALQAVSEDTVWLGVDEELWVLDREGRRTAALSAREFGFTQGISNIVPAPAGQVLLSSRGDRDWQLVDRASLVRLRTIRPQWPADIAKLPLRAVHLAVSPYGDIAAATGGGHTVLLFDREGRLLARTPPDTYRFTNGLWWSPEGWWTTDTNRFALRLLDANTLAVKRDMQLARSPVDHPYLGEAIASQGQAMPGSTQRPLATLSRLGSLMETGHLVDVFPDGSQLAYHRDPFAQLRDIAWFDGHLLAVDGEGFSILRFSAPRTAAEPFGDAGVRSELAQRRNDRAFWRTLASRYAWLLSALLLLAGLGAYARQRRLAADPVFDEAQNQPAVDWLESHGDFDRVRLEAETPREAVYLPGLRPGFLLVTNRRILLFVTVGPERRLRSEWPRRSVIVAGAPRQMSGQLSLWQRLLRPANLVLTFTTGTTLSLRCASTTTARRVARLLMSSPALPDEFTGAVPVAPPPAPQRRWQEVLASFLVPGSGQWLQGRFAAGTVLFTAALLLCIYGWAPVVWALHGPKMEVSSSSMLTALMAWLLVPLLASSDAWRFAASRR